MTDNIRLDEYTKKLLEEREKEVIKRDPINEENIAKGIGLTSPTSAVSTEETRILMEHIMQKNLFNTSKSQPHKKKILVLKKFFKMKRNQQVEVYSAIGEQTKLTIGKVAAIGRDFVMITNLKDRIWIPYTAIDSANIPYGIPSYSNSHQHYLFDNDLRTKLITNFGATVASRDTLVQQFYEESLRTSLKSWKGSWVEVFLEKESISGKITDTNDENLTLSLLNKKIEIPLKEILYIETLRFLQILIRLFK
ncbi:hypothetical protein [Bacillus sp. JJ1562]|uniref:hypothetical protein n=1 Tax=Bacillus sp. JJ1562 TaxID=3122960 RepID=UPI0030033A90